MAVTQHQIYQIPQLFKSEDLFLYTQAYLFYDKFSSNFPEICAVVVVVVVKVGQPEDQTLNVMCCVGGPHAVTPSHAEHAATKYIVFTSLANLALDF